VHEDTRLEGLDLVKLSLDVMGRSRQTPMSRAPGGFEERAAPTAAGAKGWLRQSLVPRVLDVVRPARQTQLRSAPGEGAYPSFAGAKVPMIDFDLTPDLRWLLGARMTTRSGDRYRIEQAGQQFKLRMDDTGARVKVATTLAFVATSLRVFEPTVFIVDRPFYGWWTQRGVDLPMAAFFADSRLLARTRGGTGRFVGGGSARGKLGRWVLASGENTCSCRLSAFTSAGGL
jgi:hypothetical protein